MAPNKFEKHIKKQFEEREIQPSSEAWMKLSHRLDETNIEQPRKRGYLWFAVAACLLGLLMLSAIFFNNGIPSEQPNIQVVEQEKKAKDETDDFQKLESPMNAVEVVSTETDSYENKKNSIAKTAVEIPQEEELNNELVDASNEVQIPLNDDSEDLINTKVLEVLARVDVLEEDNEALTDAKVDSLLRKAQEEILTDKLFRNNRSVDAMALLSEVESELDKSFRDQIFESLKTGFLKVRTAVADRNN